MQGCGAFDVGTFVANLIFAWIACGSTVLRAQISTMMSCTWETYCDRMKAAEPSPLPTKADVTELLHYTAGFAGCELIRRVLGAAHVADLENISDPVMRLGAERAALAAGRALVKAHAHIESFEALLDCAGV